MSNPMLAIVPVHGTSRTPSPTDDEKQDTMYLRLLEEMAKNRVLGTQLRCVNAMKRANAEKKAAKKRVRKAALKLLGWFGFGLAWGVLAMACWYLAPKWTCIAPAVLMCLAWRKAGGEV